MRIYAIAVYDAANREMFHEVVKVSGGEFAAIQAFSKLWEHIKNVAVDEKEEIPEDLESLHKFADDFELDISIIEVK